MGMNPAERIEIPKPRRVFSTRGAILKGAGVILGDRCSKEEASRSALNHPLHDHIVHSIGTAYARVPEPVVFEVPKKYTDPNDAEHTSSMFALGQAVAITARSEYGSEWQQHDLVSATSNPEGLQKLRYALGHLKNAKNGFIVIDRSTPESYGLVAEDIQAANCPTVLLTPQGETPANQPTDLA